MSNEKWQGKTNYKWVKGEGKCFSQQNYAYIILNGVKHFGEIREDFWMNYDEPDWDYTFYHFNNLDGVGLTLDNTIRGLDGWGYCIFEMPEYTGELE